EASLIAEDVESLAVGIVGGSEIVFALVEEGSGLLALEGVEMELQLVHGEGGGSFFALQQAGGAWRKCFELPDTRVSALEYGGGMQVLRKSGDDRLTDWIGVHGLGKDLEGEDVVVAVGDEAREEVRFAEDEAVGVGVVDYGLAVGERVGDALFQECGKVGDRLGGDHADGDLRGAGVEGRAQGL